MSRNPCRPGATAVAGRKTNKLVYDKPDIKNAQTTIPKRGPPPKVPGKFRYDRPKVTKAMEQRVKHAQKIQEEYQRKERERAEAAKCRRPQRTPAPIGGDARAGRERPTRPRPPPGACQAAPPAAPRSRPTSAKQAAPSGPAACSTAAPQAPPARKVPSSKRASSAPCPKQPPRQQPAREPSPPAPAAVPERTRNLAESMNADIVQAEPLQPGMVDNIIIPPGAINSEKTTIVSIPQPEAQSSPSAMHHSTIAAGSGGSMAGGAANKSMQVINEALDEQDANESAIVNSKLQDLQNARRDFVMAVANVGGNSINLGDDDFANVTPIMDISPPELMVSSEPPSARLLNFSDEEPCIDYGRHHPVVESAREYMHSRQAYQPDETDLLDPEYLEGCGLIGADDCADQLPVCGPNDNYTVIPRRREQYRYPPYQVDELEKFFDLENYPPCPQPTPPRPTGPPPGREHINPDLWELDDPWCHGPEMPDLIDWGSYC